MINVTDDDFEQVKSSAPAVVFDFWATWCAPCRRFAPAFEALAEEYEGRVKFAKCDVEEAVDTSARFVVQSVPTFLFFKDGELKDTIIGVPADAEFRSKLDALLS